jgi:UDP-glucuronate decarboxylase
MKRILVTGAAGFIGSNLCAALARGGGCRITALDNMRTGRMANMARLMALPEFEFIEHDVRGPIDIAADEIYNAACPASPPAYQSDAIGTTETSVLGAMNMLELAEKHGAKLVQFSTSEVYGEPLEHPQTEAYRGNVNPIGARSCYDEGKRCAESLCFDHRRARGARAKVIRIFNTYGPNMDPCDGRVVSNFITQALKGEPLTVYGDGAQTRSLCYIDDMVDGIMRAMATGDGFAGPVNLGNPDEHTVLELAEKILRITGSRSRIEHLPLPPDDPTKRRPDIALAKRALGWEPKTALDDGLRRSVEYFRGVA